MFEDIVFDKSEQKDLVTSVEAEQDIENNTMYMLGLLKDVESVLEEMYIELNAITGHCHYCGAAEGSHHGTLCEYYLASMRLGMEIDILKDDV